jgi:hypothetical protein
VDNWATGSGKAKDEGAGDDDEPETPVPARTKKGTATPSTGAGVKKRAGGTSTKRAASTPASGGRARRAKTEAMVKMEEDLFDDIYDDEDDSDDDNDDDETVDLGTPTPTKGKGKAAAKAKGGKGIKKSGSPTKPKRFGGAAAAGIKTEAGTPSPPNHYGLNAEYDNFPEFIPDKVIERKAILINVCGNWTVSPADEATHGQWLARLPADKQTVFYSQEAEALKAAGKAPTTARHSAGDNKGLINNPGTVAKDPATTTGPSTGNNNKGFMNDPETVARNLATMTEIQMMSANFRRGLDEMRGLASPAPGLMSPIPGLDMGMGSMGMGMGMGLGPLNMPVSMGMAASMGYMPGGGAMTATAASPRLGGFGNGRRSNPQAAVAPGTGTGFGSGRRALIAPPVPSFDHSHGGGAEMSSFEEEMKQIEQRDRELLFGGAGCLNDDDEEDGY